MNVKSQQPSPSRRPAVARAMAGKQGYGRQARLWPSRNPNIKSQFYLGFVGRCKQDISLSYKRWFFIFRLYNPIMASCVFRAFSWLWASFAISSLF